MVLVVMSKGDFCGIFKFAGEGGCILYGVWGALPFPGAGLPVLPPCVWFSLAALLHCLCSKLVLAVLLRSMITLCLYDGMGFVFCLFSSGEGGVWLPPLPPVTLPPLGCLRLPPWPSGSLLEGREAGW